MTKRVAVGLLVVGGLLIWAGLAGRDLRTEIKAVVGR